MLLGLRPIVPQRRRSGRSAPARGNEPCRRATFTQPDFSAALGAYPDSAVAQPQLFSRVAVPNLCTA